VLPGAFHTTAPWVRWVYGMTDEKKPTTAKPTTTKEPTETRVVAPVDPTRRTEIDKQRVPMSARP
jgi:hypothetical protein